MITGPQQMAALPRAALAVEQANFRALDNRMWSSLNAPRSPGNFQGGRLTTTAAATCRRPTNGSAHMNTVTVGLDMKLSDKMLAGAMFGYTDNKGDFGGPGGGYTLKQPVGTVYGGYGDGPWYVGRNAWRRQSRLFRHLARDPARRRAADRERGGSRLRIYGAHSRRLLVHDARPDARPVCATPIHEGRREAVLRTELGFAGAEL
jgi:hypothetical protein